MNYIDLFAGAGGLSEGFIQAGFKPIAHVESDVHACTTLKTRLVYHLLKEKNSLELYEDYLLGKISRDKIINTLENSDFAKSVINGFIGLDDNWIFDIIENRIGAQKVDLIIGGPPCQAYSLVGRSRDKNNMKDDARNYLYLGYAKYLERFRPKVFVFENVLGLITANQGKYFQDMQDHFRDIGYSLDYAIQKSEDFGVLQKRRRIILIGWKKDIDFAYPDFKKLENDYVIRDVLVDLKRLKPGEISPITDYQSEPTQYLSQFKIRGDSQFVTQHVARPHNSRDLKIYEIAIKKWICEGERLKYPDLPSKLKTHNNERSFIDRFKVVNINGLSHTVVAHIAKDGHYYIYPDLKQIRSISVREAARIQSFPDDYFFEGGRSAAFKQIGNAVPPLMSKAIAKSIKEALCQRN